MGKKSMQVEKLSKYTIYTSVYTYVNNNNQMLHAYELDIA